jgi:hypothetical protein
VAWIPKAVHSQIRQLILVNQRSMTHYVVRGLKHVLTQASREWPREYFDTLVEKEMFARSAKRYKVAASTAMR